MKRRTVLAALLGCTYGRRVLATPPQQVLLALGVAPIFNPGTWATSTAIGTATTRMAACGSGSSAALYVGGTESIFPQSNAYTFNGSSWTGASNMPAARYSLGVVGTTASALAMAGRDTGWFDTTTVYNGSSWGSAAAGIATARSNFTFAGTPSAALIAGGFINATTRTNTTESYNGSSWSAGGNLAAAKRSTAGCGSNTAALSVGGNAAGGDSTVVEVYNGSTWSTTTALSSTITDEGACGTKTAALVYGGYRSGAQAGSNAFDGTAWAARGNMVAARYNHGAAGASGSGAIAIGGYNISDAEIASVEVLSG